MAECSCRNCPECTAQDLEKAEARILELEAELAKANRVVEEVRGCVRHARLSGKAYHLAPNGRVAQTIDDLDR